MKESDWKKFKVIKEQALDKFCEDTLEKADEIISDNSSDFHERYLALYEHIQKSDKSLASTFNGCSRSNAWLQLMLMRKLNLVTDEAFSDLSSDFQNECNPFKKV